MCVATMHSVLCTLKKTTTQFMILTYLWPWNKVKVIKPGRTIIIIYPFTMRVVGEPQMISQPHSSIFPCSPLPSGTWWTPGLSIPWWCLPTASSVCLVFFPLSLCLARWFWLDLMNGRHVHITAVCVFMWSNCLLDLGMDFLVSKNMVLVWVV